MIEPAVDFYAQVAEEDCKNFLGGLNPDIRNYNFFSDEDGMGIKLSYYKIPMMNPEAIPHYGETWEIILTKCESEGDFFLYSVKTKADLEAFSINKVFNFDTSHSGNGTLELYMDAGTVEGKEDLLGQDLRVGCYYNLTMKKIKIEIEDLTEDEE